MKNTNTYISLITAIMYSIYSYFFLDMFPKLDDVFIVILTVITISTAIKTFFDILRGNKSLGDFEEQKYIFSLGALAVIWISIQSIIDKF